MLRIANLSGIFTGEGFAKKQGRNPLPVDCGFRQGPIDIVCSRTTGLIVAILPTREAKRQVYPETLDGSGLIATSGFIDSHTHALFAGQRAGEYFQRWSGKNYREISDAGGGIHRTVADTNACSDDRLLWLLHDRLSSMLASGTTVVEVKTGYADTPEGELRLLRILEQAKRGAGPEIRPTFLGLHTLPSNRDERDYCSAMIELLPKIKRESLAVHADAFPEKGFFSLAESTKFLTAARGSGMFIKVHADELSDLGTSAAMIRLGATSIDHLEHIDDEAVELLGRRLTVATLLPATSFFLQIEYANARRLIDAGARVAIATDFNPGSAPASDFQLSNLLCASHFHMSVAEILCACTYNGAAALGLEGSRGTLLEDGVADIALWNTGESKHSLEGDVCKIIVDRLRPVHVIARGRHAIGQRGNRGIDSADRFGDPECGQE